MSNTYVAGARLRASYMAPQRVWTVTTTSNSAGITVEAITDTSPSTVYRNGGAWRLTYRSRVTAATANQLFGQAIRDTNIAGFIRMSTAFTPVITTSANATWVHWEHIIANSSGSDVTRVLVATGISTSGAMTLTASSVFPRYWTCDYIGLADDFPEAVLF